MRNYTVEADVHTDGLQEDVMEKDRGSWKREAVLSDMDDVLCQHSVLVKRCGQMKRSGVLGEPRARDL